MYNVKDLILNHIDKLIFINYFMKKLTFSGFIFIFNILLFCIIAVCFWEAHTLFILLSAIFGLMATRAATKGRWTTFLFDIISNALYIQICIDQKYFGELILSVLVIIIHMYGLFEWRKKRFENSVAINHLSGNEIKFTMFVFGVLFVSYALILGQMHSALPILNAFSTITYFLGNYYAYRRSILQFYLWSLYELSFIMLWTFSAIRGDLSSAILLIGGVGEFVFDIIGIKNWKKVSNYQTFAMRAYNS